MELDELGDNLQLQCPLSQQVKMLKSAHVESLIALGELDTQRQTHANTLDQFLNNSPIVVRGDNDFIPNTNKHVNSNIITFLCDTYHCNINPCFHIPHPSNLKGKVKSLER